jgi:hypothetical protein
MATKEQRRRKNLSRWERRKINAKRDYKKEYERDQSSARRIKYRTELNKRAYAMGHYGKTPPGKDLVHKNGSIAGLGDRKENRADGARKATLARLKRKRAARAV